MMLWGMMLRRLVSSVVSMVHCVVNYWAMDSPDHLMTDLQGEVAR